MVAGVVIGAETPLQPDIQRLIAASDDFSASLYPAEGRHPVDVARLAAPDVRFLVARRDGVAVGCIAVLVAPPAGEIKRLFVASEARGLKLGAALLAAIEAEARRERLSVLRLETGPRNASALALYTAGGYQPCGPFPPYGPSPHSIFMEKPLT
ncbi:MAG: GNAT family N-acetyltransferase [Phreatobacter sp.]|uniref:GNAT family N-acetyltransferase n=1 Tax=Phreatobacter sp. TaxID=1966341 RepID=UPI001A4B10D9|nr:GNAT family N-acetyltransferase [Phreatobacter sp.]MBL8568837.1 GNAT family N-acetyltransferase [Phreatobacter sp.]